MGLLFPDNPNALTMPSGNPSSPGLINTTAPAPSGLINMSNPGLPSGFVTQPSGGGGGDTGGYGGGSYVGGDGGAAAAAAAARAAQQAENNKQIDAINSMLGLTAASKQSGLDRLNAGFNEKNTRLGEQRAQTAAEYAKQKTLNDKNRMRGYEQVDNFANTSNNNLQRIFQGANSGNSSVSRLLAPHLVGKAAGTRRTGVTETANENQDNIFTARDKANKEYDWSAQDLANQKSQQEEDFLRGINQNESDLYSKKQAFEQAGGIANADTQAQIDQRFANLNALFGQFAPKYNVRDVAPKAVNLNSYSVDPAQIRLDQNAPAETRYYGPQLKKKQEMA